MNVTFHAGIEMASHPNTRGLAVRSQVNKNGQRSKVNSENGSKPPLPGKSNSSTFLRDTTNKMLGIKRKADSALEAEKNTKKRAAFGDITNVSYSSYNFLLRYVFDHTPVVFAYVVIVTLKRPIFPLVLLANIIFLKYQ